MMPVGMAWQRQIREQIASEDSSNEHSQNIAMAEVRRIDWNEARLIIERYEWLGKMGAVGRAYGIYFGGELAGAVTYSPEPCENFGRWDKYGFTGKIILLSRGACVHWAHPHSASKLIRGSMRLLPDRYEIVTATVDPGAGEIGTIYQACGFVYAPTSGRPYVEGAIICGEYHPMRSLQRLFGTKSIRVLKSRYGDENVIRIMGTRKGRYFAFRGNSRAKRNNRAAIEHLIKPYPRRSPDASPAQIYEGLTA